MGLDGLTRTLHDTAAPFSAGTSTISRDHCLDVLEGLLGRDAHTGARAHSVEEVRAALSTLRSASVTDQAPLSETDFGRLDHALTELVAFQSGLDQNLHARQAVAGPLGLNPDSVSSTPTSGVFHAPRPHLRDDRVLRSGTGTFDMATIRSSFTQCDWDRRTHADTSRCAPTAVIVSALEAGGARGLEHFVDALLRRCDVGGETNAGQRAFLNGLRARLHSGGDVTVSDLSTLAEHALHIHQRATGDTSLHGTSDEMLANMAADAQVATSSPPTPGHPRIATIVWDDDHRHEVSVGIGADGHPYIYDPFPRYGPDGSALSQTIREGDPAFADLAARMHPALV
jgi:hypothetical protein